MKIHDQVRRCSENYNSENLYNIRLVFTFCLELFHSMWDELASTFENFLFATRFVRDCGLVVVDYFRAFRNFVYVLATLLILKH